MNHETVINVLTRQRQQFDNRRSIRTYKNYRNVLILTQPTSGSCVQVIDGHQPEFSSAENEDIMTIAPYSEIDLVLADEAPHTPPEVVFGPQPPRTWCYYYEKASLARQQGDWQLVVQLGEEAYRQGVSPEDPIEWMPFLQAYVLSGDTDRLAELAPSVTRDSFVTQQACRILAGMDAGPETKTFVNELYCLSD